LRISAKVITPLVLPAAIAVTAPPRQPLFDPVFASALPTALETVRARPDVSEGWYVPADSLRRHRILVF
jgi:hypothetical protein